MAGRKANRLWPEEPEWLTINEAADLTGIPVTTLRWHCRESRGYFYGQTRFVQPNLPANMRSYEIPKTLLCDFVEERRQQ